MQFQVPQFIETEDKIIGPFTIKQFLYVAAAGGLSFALFFQFTSIVLWLMSSMILGGISLALAFIKINGRPLPTVAIAALSYYWKPRLYIWKHEEPATPDGPAMPKLPAMHEASKKPVIESLWQQLTTSKTPIPKREKMLRPGILDRVKSSKERFEMIRQLTGDREVSRRVDYR